MGERAEFLLQSRDSPAVINSEIWASPPWSICSVMISEQRWKLQGREVPPRGSKWGWDRQVLRVLSREKKREIVSFPLGCLPVYCLFVVSWVSLWGENSGVTSPGIDETFLPSWGSLLSAGVFLARCWVSWWGTRGAVFTTKPHRQGQVWQAGDPSPGLSLADSWPLGTVKWVLQASLWTQSPSVSLSPWLFLFKSKRAVFSQDDIPF